MATQVQFRGGTTAEHGSFTGAVREVTVDTDKETVVVHDGSTAGGFPLARQDGSNVTNFVVGGTLGVTGVLTTTAATVFNGGFASNAASTLTVTEGNHVNGLKLINSEPGGYGSALTFQSERSDNNAIVSAAQIRTQGQDSWNSEASADSNLFFATSLNGSLTDKMVIKDDGNVGIGTSSPDYLVEVEKANGDHTGTAIAITNSQDGGYGSVLNFVSKRDGAGNVIASQIGTQGQDSWNSDASTSSNLLFSTVNANTLAERMKIHSNGVVSASAGVALGVGTANTASNVLDDYEEGTWTPTGTNLNASLSVGTYTKIGNTVHIHASVRTDGTDLNLFGGLPFTPTIANNTGNGACGHVGAFEITTALTTAMSILVNDSSEFFVTSTWKDAGNRISVGSYAMFSFTGTYKTT